MQIKSILAEGGIQEMLRSIENRYGILLTIHDLRGKLVRKDQTTSILPARYRVHPHECCRRIRLTVEKRCYKECFTETEELLKQNCQSFEKTCWANITELVVPITRKGIHELTIFAGVFRKKGSCEKEFPEWFQKAHAAIPEYDHILFHELNLILQHFGKALLSLSEEQEQSKDIRESEILTAIREHLHQHFTRNMLAKKIHLSSSRTGVLVKEKTGKTFPELLAEERVRRAKILLQESDRKIADIAESTGFRNVFYFSRVFRKYTGKTPLQWKKQS